MKIDGNMTLFELKEYCRSQTCCSGCDFYNTNSNTSRSCEFQRQSPAYYPLHKPKTYKEYFLEKFPNARVSIKTGDPTLCLMNIYGETLRPYICNSYHCNVCWNRVMPEDE